MSRNCVINLWNEHDWDLDSDMMEFAMLRAARHAHNASHINIYPQERIPMDAPEWKYPGRIEWIMNIDYHSGGRLTLGLLQRGPGQPFESHS